MIDYTFRTLTTWPGKKTPIGRQRRAQFSATLTQTWKLLGSELSHLGAKNVVIEADCDASQIRNDGKLRADARLRGPGIVLSFDGRHGSLRFPCDTFTHWTDNLRAIALSMEALRAVDRYGVTQKAEQYTGWTALPDKSTEVKNARQAAAEWIVQQCYSEKLAPPTVDQIIREEGIRREFYKALAVRLHPDRKGSDELFKQLQQHISAF